MWAKIGAWLLSKVTGDFFAKMFGYLSKTDAGQLRLAEINATSAIAMKKEDTAQLVAILGARGAAQQAKMNWPVFWVLICGMMLWPFMTLGAITLYNIFWWENGIWPQPWEIAAYPPSVAHWVDASINWLYDPLGPPAGVGSALVAGLLTGRRR